MNVDKVSVIPITAPALLPLGGPYCGLTNQTRKGRRHLFVIFVIKL